MELQPSTRKGEACATDSWRCFSEESKSRIYIRARVCGYNWALDIKVKWDLSLT